MDVTITKGFTQKTCGTCGVVFFIPDELENEAHKTRQAWYCPNGHCRSYTESDADKYKRLYEAEKSEKEKVNEYRKNAMHVIEDMEKKIEKLQTKKAPKKKVKS
jgi:hypothetical protein